MHDTEERCMVMESPKKCARKGCEKLFKPKKPWQRFHSSNCRDRHHAAERKAALDAFRTSQAS